MKFLGKFLLGYCIVVFLLYGLMLFKRDPNRAQSLHEKLALYDEMAANRPKPAPPPPKTRCIDPTWWHKPHLKLVKVDFKRGELDRSDTGYPKSRVYTVTITVKNLTNTCIDNVRAVTYLYTTMPSGYTSRYAYRVDKFPEDPILAGQMSTLVLIWEDYPRVTRAMIHLSNLWECFGTSRRGRASNCDDSHTLGKLLGPVLPDPQAERIVDGMGLEWVDLDGKVRPDALLLYKF